VKCGLTLMTYISLMRGENGPSLLGRITSLRRFEKRFNGKGEREGTLTRSEGTFSFAFFMGGLWVILI